MKDSTQHALRAGLVTCAILSAIPNGAGRRPSRWLAISLTRTTAPESTWSYRLDDRDNDPHAFPLLTRTSRNANEIWGSSFPTPPQMWSEETGHWGIGKNVTGEEQFSSRNDSRWTPGEVLLHPKAGGPASGLVVCWTAPDRMAIDIHYKFHPHRPRAMESDTRSSRVPMASIRTSSLCGTSAKNSLTICEAWSWTKGRNSFSGLTRAAIRPETLPVRRSSSAVGTRRRQPICRSRLAAPSRREATSHSASRRLLKGRTNGTKMASLLPANRA